LRARKYRHAIMRSKGENAISICLRDKDFFAAIFERHTARRQFKFILYFWPVCMIQQRNIDLYETDFVCSKESPDTVHIRGFMRMIVTEFLGTVEQSLLDRIQNGLSRRQELINGNGCFGILA